MVKTAWLFLREVLSPCRYQGVEAQQYKFRKKKRCELLKRNEISKIVIRRHARFYLKRSIRHGSLQRNDFSRRKSGTETGENYF